MVSKSSYNELMQAYDERGALLFEAIHLLNQAVKLSDVDSVAGVEEQLDLLSHVDDFLSRARLSGMA